MNWVTVIASLVAAMLGTGGTAAIIQAVARRKTTKVEAVDRLNDVTLEWAEALRADAREARADAREARQDAADARRAAERSERKVEELAAELRTLHTVIYEPGATIERLRLLIASNGRSTDPH